MPAAFADTVFSIYGPADPILLGTDTTDPRAATSSALFADGRHGVSDQLTVHFGVRYNVEKISNDFASTITVESAENLTDAAFYSTVDPTLGFVVSQLTAYLFSLVDAASGNPPFASQEFEAFLPKAGVTWNWNSDISTSFIVQRAYRSGGGKPSAC